LQLKMLLVNHLVGRDLQSLRQCQAKLLRGLEIDRETRTWLGALLADRQLRATRSRHGVSFYLLV